jgi:hypothetical protein
MLTPPRYSGTYGGFVGVLVGCGIFVLLVVLILLLLRIRSLRRRNATSSSSFDHEQGGVERWAEEHDDAFEMPSSLRTPGGGHGYAAPGAPYSPSESMLHLSPTPGGGDGAPKLYANEGISQEAFFDEEEARRYAEGNRGGTGDEGRYDDRDMKGEGEGETTPTGGRRSPAQ